MNRFVSARDKAIDTVGFFAGNVYRLTVGKVNGRVAMGGTAAALTFGAVFGVNVANAPAANAEGTDDGAAVVQEDATPAAPAPEAAVPPVPAPEPIVAAPALAPQPAPELPQAPAPTTPDAAPVGAPVTLPDVPTTDPTTTVAVEEQGADGQTEVPGSEDTEGTDTSGEDATEEGDTDVAGNTDSDATEDSTESIEASQAAEDDSGLDAATNTKEVEANAEENGSTGDQTESEPEPTGESFVGKDGSTYTEYRVVNTDSDGNETESKYWINENGEKAYASTDGNVYIERTDEDGKTVWDVYSLEDFKNGIADNKIGEVTTLPKDVCEIPDDDDKSENGPPECDDECKPKPPIIIDIDKIVNITKTVTITNDSSYVRPASAKPSRALETLAATGAETEPVAIGAGALIALGGLLKGLDVWRQRRGRGSRPRRRGTLVGKMIDKSVDASDGDNNSAYSSNQATYEEIKRIWGLAV